MAKSRTVTVKKVLDGDTFVTGENEKIKIAGVDTPEKGKPGSARARTYLKKQIEGDRVLLRPVARDKYGRTVAYVYKKGKSIGKKIIKGEVFDSPYRKTGQANLHKGIAPRRPDFAKASPGK